MAFLKIKKSLFEIVYPNVLRDTNRILLHYLFTGLAPYPTRGKFSQSFIALPVFGTKKLRCDVTGDRPLTYQWYKNGKMILSHRGLSNSTRTTLRLRNIQKSDSGLYTCRVSNPYGVYEHNITLQVSRK